MVIYAVIAAAITAISNGIHCFAALILLSLLSILILINNKNNAAIIQPRTGEITQLAAIFPIVNQFTIFIPAAARPPPKTPPTIE